MKRKRKAEEKMESADDDRLKKRMRKKGFGDDIHTESLEKEMNENVPKINFQNVLFEELRLVKY